MRMVVSTNFVFETDAAKLNLWFTPALILTFSPGRRNSVCIFPFSRQSVRQIQTREFSRRL